MALKKLYIFVEGNDDELFFSRLIIPLLKKFYDDIEIVQYAQMKRTKVDLFLLSIQTLNFDYFLAADIDMESSVGAKKKIIKARFEMVRDDDIIVVIKEIESWFLAGVNYKTENYLDIKHIDNTEAITKEMFSFISTQSFRSKIDFMQEIIKKYDYETAKNKNSSFRFFANNFIENNKLQNA